MTTLDTNRINELRQAIAARDAGDENRARSFLHEAVELAKQNSYL